MAPWIAKDRLSGTSAPASPVPTLVQMIASSSNPVGLGISGDAFKLPLVSVVGAGNCLVLFITYPHGNTPTITDNNGNSWPAAARTVDAGSGAFVAACFVLPNANAGLTTVTVTFGADVIPFQYDLLEYRNVATASPVSNSVGTAGVSAPSLACGSFTPGNNDANGGNLVLAYFGLAANASDNPTSWVPGGSFTLLEGDITWSNNQGVPHAASAFVQASAAALNPAVTATADTGNSYNCLAIALKAATAGSAPAAGIHVDKVLHFTAAAPTSPQALQIPSGGNLRVLVTANNPSLTNISSVVDSEGHAWTEVTNPGDSPQMFYREGCSPNSALIVTVTFTGTSTFSFRYSDVSGAVNSGALDGSAATSSTTADGQTAMSNQPSGLIPGSNKGVTIACMGIGQGPGLSVTSPVGAAWGLTTYANEIDVDLMENADAFAIYYYNSTAAQAFNWTLSSQPSNSVFATAAAFKSA